jgi:hypothetical protein
MDHSTKDRGGYPVTKLFSCQVGRARNAHARTADTRATREIHMHMVPLFFHKNGSCPTCTVATAGSLLAWPCDASWRLWRLHGSTRLAAASQAAIAAVPRPWPPRTLHLLLLGGCFRRPSERPERARARPPPATQTAKPPPQPPPTLRPSSLLLLSPFQPPSQPHRPLEPPHEACTQRTRKGQKRCTSGGRAGQNG